ncbi:MAG: hypothetical protein AB1422_18450 [bacterium]
MDLVSGFNGFSGKRNKKNPLNPFNPLTIKNGKRSGGVTKGDVEIKEIGRYY